ncbi:MAG: malto-oligosyltrehalose trehalohydrolase [Solirubrobacterales bacterium]
MTRVGAQYVSNNRCEFRVWAPLRRQVALRILTPSERDLSLDAGDLGYWQTTADDVSPGSRYSYLLDDTTLRPDPASHFQPESIHGPSQVVDHGSFVWTDAGWEGVPLEDMVIYELHVGTFTTEGTFEAVIPRLGELQDLGINAIELMPVAQFPGDRNWGYDGAYPYATQNTYGGPRGLKTLVNAIHQHGMSAILDVVYNHMGPEGNYLRDFGPYFTGRYRTPWGDAINFDDAYSYGVRDFVIENALFWLRDYHFDALRLDALHMVYDQSAKHIIQELTETVAEFSRRSAPKRYLIGESDLDDVRFIKPVRDGGYGLDAQWLDDFHHSLHALVTGEDMGYYADFGRIEQLAKAMREGFVYTWQYSRHRKKFHGSSSRQRPARQFVVFAQNHDHVGNRMLGERLSQLADFESLKLIAGVLLLSPYVPLLFMGEEYADDSPFLYFVSHTDEQLVAAVREGRRAEFAAFQGQQECPDPQGVESFRQSKLQWESRNQSRHRVMLDFHKRLLTLRRQIPNIVSRKGLTVDCLDRQQVLLWHRRHAWGQVHGLMNFSSESQTIRLPAQRMAWTKILDSADPKWEGPGSALPDAIRNQRELTIPPRSLAVYQAGASVTEQQAREEAVVAL